MPVEQRARAPRRRRRGSASSAATTGSLPVALALVLADRLLDVDGQLAPGREAVLARDDELRVAQRQLAAREVGEPRHVGAHAAQRLVVGGPAGRDQRQRALLVPRDRLPPDAADRRLGLARLDPARELGPGAEAVLLRDQPLRVAQPEALARPLAERLLDARDRVGVARARTRGRAPSPACGTTRGRGRAGSSWCMTNLLRQCPGVRLSRAGKRSSFTGRAVRALEVGMSLSADRQRPRSAPQSGRPVPSRRSRAPSGGCASSRARPR